jgi:hypothetical protein
MARLTWMSSGKQYSEIFQNFQRDCPRCYRKIYLKKFCSFHRGHSAAGELSHEPKFFPANEPKQESLAAWQQARDAYLAYPLAKLANDPELPDSLNKATNICY